MATLHIDKIIAEKVNQDDLIRLLETVIDEEMQRPEAEMNCDLIDQCVDALLEMRQDRDHLAVMVPLMQDKAFLHLIQRKAGNTARLNGAARGALIAAAILASTMAWSFFASSYSLFSERSPKERATLIFSAISLRRSVFKNSSSCSKLCRPSSVNNTCFAAIYPLPPLCEVILETILLL